MVYLLWCLVASHSPQRLMFKARPVNVGFVVDKVSLGEVLLAVFQFLWAG